MSDLMVLEDFDNYPNKILFQVRPHKNRVDGRIRLAITILLLLIFIVVSWLIDSPRLYYLRY